METGQALLLTLEEVGKIRHYVRHKFASLPLEHHAEIVADAVRRIIVKQLPDFEENTKQRMTDTLIRNTVLEQRRPVSADDVLKICLQEDWKADENLVPIHQWVNRRLNQELPLSWLVEVMDNYVDGKHTRLSAPSATLWSTLNSSVERIGGHVDLPQPVMAKVIPLYPLTQWYKRKAVLYGLLSMLLVVGITLYGMGLYSGTPDFPQPDTNDAIPVQEKRFSLTANELPPELQYQAVDKIRLKQFLHNKSSMLKQTPYFEGIVAAAEKYNVHPLLLFAITGQEQGFVPKNHKSALMIANNPFNVFHSWTEFNTTIEHSASIAAQTIVNMSKDRPEGTNAIAWINRKYAEDPDWHKGVSSIFKSLTLFVEDKAAR
jgi:hypothetical protein